MRTLNFSESSRRAGISPYRPQYRLPVQRRAGTAARDGTRAGFPIRAQVDELARHPSLSNSGRPSEATSDETRNGRPDHLKALYLLAFQPLKCDFYDF